MVSTAMIDTGVMKHDWYQYYASKFVVFTSIAQILNTIICWILHSKAKVLSEANLGLKTGLTILLVIQLLISSRLADNYGSSLLEWTLTVNIVAGFYSMGVDV